MATSTANGRTLAWHVHARAPTRAATRSKTTGTCRGWVQVTRTVSVRRCCANARGTAREVGCRAARPNVAFAATTELKEIDKDSFEEVLREAKDKLVVIDFYTNWCGPCKVIYPKLVELQNEMPDVALVKFNCNEYNKPLAKELGIRVAPTFKLYKNSTKVAEVTGAKVDVLKDLILKHK